MAHDPNTSELDYIVSECLVVVAQNCSIPISEEATQFWVDRYRRLFYKAMTEKGRTWKKDRDNVLARATRLGQTAAQLSQNGSITRAIAKKASEQTDCKARVGSPRTREMWCEG